MHDANLDTDEVGLDVAFRQLFNVTCERIGQGVIERKLCKNAELLVDLEFGTGGEIEGGLQPTILVEAGIGIALLGA